MPDISRYQTVFRVAKPNPSRRSGKGSKHKQQSNGSLDDEDNVSKAQAQLQRLEAMVTMLMQTSQGTVVQESQRTVPSMESSTDVPPASTKPNAISPSTKASFSASEALTNGHLDIRGTETKYLGATHWAAILENIKDIQGCLAPDPVDAGGPGPSEYTCEPDTLLSSSKPLTLADICESLPPRPVVDRLLSTHFNAKYMHMSFIHRGKFLREYESFWNDPSSVSFLWISILFSVLHLGHQICQFQGQEVILSPKHENTDSFLTRAAQALVAGQYQKARPYSVEATMLYAICRFFQKHDSDTEPWLMIGVAARLALRMGYHRDPRHLAHITPFEGEMRRRTFSTVQTFELLLSFQAGLPAIIHEQVCDTEPPRNLFDDDFDESSASIPPSRPPTESTPMLYFCYKGRVAQTFRKIARQALSPRLPVYSDVMQLDAELRQTRSEIPPSLVLRPLSTPVMDETYAIIHSLNLELLYQKSMMILHRRYLSHDRLNSTYQYSRDAGLAASLQVLRYQAEVDQASRPGGQLQDGRWSASSIALHDFLLAAMITCLDLYESHRETRSTMLPTGLEAQREKYDALQISQQIWQSRRPTSPDAKRASDVLAVMLSKIPRPDDATEPTENGDVNSSHDLARPSRDAHADGNTEKTASNFGLATEFATSEGSGLSWRANPLETPDLSSQDFLDQVFADSDILDWSVFDQYIQDGATPTRSFDF
ncbi:hypothetical protein PV04_10571 [Phialophora macrospora]|uniref:Xylanolytic transcriptional activator regulatory domain-containing protein n=1 Tax=Phialophora macrospora TaxID=1851006 RepID=A0A0D2CBL6_9EURO|nr:hypothetical protein PV04_10571 [Phialophora macrospora]